MWRQRSRAVWLKEGDINTKFFHRTANAHKRYNNIDNLQVNGEIVENPEDIKREIVAYYQNLYTETKEWRPQCNLRDCPTINTEDNQMLLSPFDPQEIWESVKACAGDKAPGPDGYTMAFYTQCWEVIGSDVIAAVQNFHANGTFEKSFNATLLALIPKKVGAKELKDFRPISLI